MLQTHSQLAPAYVPTSSVQAAAARARAEREDNSPWVFVLAPFSFALTLGGIVYLSLISF